MNTLYSNLLHGAARKWNLPVMPGEPLIDYNTSHYPSLEVVERFHWRGKGFARANIEVVTLNGLWSFSAGFSIRGVGASFGSFLKFCDPVSCRGDAISAAIKWLRGNGAKKDTDLSSWLEDLEDQVIPQQLRLF